VHADRQAGTQRVTLDLVFVQSNPARHDLMNMTLRGTCCQMHVRPMSRPVQSPAGY